MRRSLPHTKVVKAKGKEYVYFKTGQTTPDGKPIYKRLPGFKDPAFGATYAAHLAQLTRRANTKAAIKVPELADMYQKSPHYRNKLSAGTHKIYSINLRRLCALLPTAPAGSLERAHIARLVDKMGETPGAANSFLSTIGALFKWARERGHVANDPTRDIEPMKVGEHAPWPEAILSAALAAEPGRMRLAVHLLFYTSQRIGDVCRARWSDVQGDRIMVRVQKTKRMMDIPLHPALAAELANAPKTGLTILTDANGRSVKQDAIRSEIQAFTGTFGVKLVPHGLRKNAVNALLEAGCSAAEAASVSGQSLQMIEHYAKERSQSTLATAAVLKWRAKS